MNKLHACTWYFFHFSGVLPNPVTYFEGVQHDNKTLNNAERPHEARFGYIPSSFSGTAPSGMGVSIRFLLPTYLNVSLSAFRMFWYGQNATCGQMLTRDWKIIREYTKAKIIIINVSSTRRSTGLRISVIGERTLKGHIRCPWEGGREKTIIHEGWENFQTLSDVFYGVSHISYDRTFWCEGQRLHFCTALLHYIITITLRRVHIQEHKHLTNQ